MPRKLNPQNLTSFANKTAEERRELAKKAGKQSGIVRREKKKLSDIYARALAATYDITVEPEVIAPNGKSIRQKKTVKMQGEKLFDYVLGKILERGDSASVSLLKNIGELTEGQKHVLSQDPEHPLDMTINIIGVKSDDKKSE